VFALTVIDEFRWRSTSMIEQSSIFFRVRVSIVSLSILFFDKTRIMFSRFIISESTQNDAFSLTRAEIEIEIQILISISWREKKDLISKSMRLRLRLVFDINDENCLKNLVDENDCSNSIFVFLILLLRDDEILLHVSLRIKLIRFLTVFSKLNDETFNEFTRNREFILFLFVFILRCSFILIRHLKNQTVWSMMLHAMHIWIFFESACEQLSMLCFFAHCSQVIWFQ
jgi:hypothetical protein